MQRGLSKLFALAFCVVVGTGMAIQARAAGILREVYSDIPGSDLASLTNNPAFPDHPTSTNVVTDFFEAPTNEDDNYGQRMRGYIVPPVTGDYFFMIASDDQSALFLSTDDNPANKVEIAYVQNYTSPRQWDAEPNQVSGPLRLQANKRYYIEALMKEGTGGDNLAVGWLLPDGTLEAPIPASRLFPSITPIIPPTISSQPTNTTVPEAATAVFRVGVRNQDPLTYQWFRNGAPIPGAVYSSYTNAVVSVYDQGDRYSCALTNSLGSTNSSEAVLTVIPDTTPPTVVSVANIGGKSVVIVFSEPIVRAAQASSYSLDKNVSVLSASYSTNDTRSVILTTTPLAMRTEYTLTLNDVSDKSAAKNSIAPNTRWQFTTSEMAPLDIGYAPQPGLFLPTRDGFDLTINGGDIGGTADRFFFSYQEFTGNFDLKVCVQSLNAADPFARAGLMARESLQTNSRFAGVFSTPNVGGCFFQYRQTTGSVSAINGSFPVNYPNTWLRLQRNEDVFTGYASYDGGRWTTLGSVKLTMTNSLYFGVAVSGRGTNTLAAAEFRNLASAGNLAPTAHLPATIEPLGPSSRRTGLVLSEIMYHPPARADGKDLEFLELYNTKAFPEDISGYRLDSAVNFTFPAGTVLAPGAFLVVARNAADFRSVYGLTNVLGGYSGRLSNRLDAIRLLDNLQAVLLEVRYSSDPPWPAAADGAGHSLVLAQPSLGEGNPAAWRASDLVGGSPGGAEVIRDEPLRAVVINEFLAHSGPGGFDFIELYNHSNEALDISGCILSDDPATNKFVVPAATTIPAHGFALFREDRLGFGLNAGGETLYFRNPSNTRVLDSIRFGPQPLDMSTGRFPDGAATFRLLAAPSPDFPNRDLFLSKIVINEIMYNPISHDNRDEYVELYNRGTTAVQLEGWSLTGGISYQFPAGAVLRGGGYLVVAKDSARLLTAYTNLNSTNLWGDYQGQLSNRGERLALAMPEDLMRTNANGIVTTNRVNVVVNEVEYGSGGRWGRWSDGGGSSLELTDPRSDNQLASNWADSDETGKSDWTSIEHTGVLDIGDPNFNIDNVAIVMLGAGECLVDNVEVLNAGGVNVVPNSTFESGAFEWIVHGNHKHSLLQDRGGYNSNRCLHVVATERGDPGPNQIYANLAGPLPLGSTATIRAKVRWLRGWPEVLFRLHGNFLEATGPMLVPRNLGTPGLPNSRLIKNAGPAIYEVSHSPALPASFQPVLVTARVHDPDGIASIVLNYRFDPSISTTVVKMLDDGTGGDAVPGDGIFTATIPGQPAGTLIAFSIKATDQSAAGVSMTFPSDAPVRECLVRFGETQPAGSFGTYYLWFTQATFDEWSSREQGSNEPLDATFAYGNGRVVYNMQTMYSGSPWHWSGYDTPTGNMCTYVMLFPPDDLFLGAGDFVLNATSNMGSDTTAQREQFVHEMGRQLGLPYTYRRFINLYVIGVHRSFIFEDAQQPNGDFLQQWFSTDTGGNLYKLEDWFEFDPNFSYDNFDATLDNFVSANGEKKLARYRWCWRKRAVQSSANDYADIFALVNAANYSDTNGYTAQVEAQVDIEQWMRTMAMRHAVGDWDSYGYERGKNMYAYKTPTGKWQLLNWDIAFAMGLGDGPTTDVFFNRHMYDGAPDVTVERMFQNPPFRRAYLRALQDILDGPFQASFVESFTQPKYAALVGNAIPVTSPSTFYSWIASRRTYIQKVLNTNAANFVVTSSGGHDFSTNRSIITLQGTAPVTVETIKINGIAYAPQWTSVTNWTITLPLVAGANSLLIQGYDGRSQPLTNATGAITVTYLGPTELPQDRVVINEIMYHPDLPNAEYVEIYNSSQTQAFDLSGWRIDGINFTFGDGSVILPQGFLVIAKSQTAFEQAYGFDIPLAGEFPGQLQHGGETLALVKPGATAAQDVIIDQVTYDDRAPWPVAADGAGSSLQLVDPSKDNNRVANWTAVNTNGMAEPRWQLVSVTGVATGSQLSLQLNAAGEVYLDELMLVEGIVPRTGNNLINNGDFEAALAGTWTLSPEYAPTEISQDKAHSGKASLHLVATAQATNQAAAVTQQLVPNLNSGQYYTLSYWYLSSPTATNLTVKLDGDGLISSQTAQPDALARRTPGQPNSVRATVPPFAPLRINEVQAENIGIVADQAGLKNPWIELYNSGPTAVSLAGYYLTDDFTNLTRWAFPNTAQIQPGQFLLIWIDGQTSPAVAGELHASFRLAPATGSVALVRLQNGQPAVVDYVHYTGLNPGQSFGSYPDGKPNDRQVFPQGTPGASNQNGFSPVQVRINEWMASNTRTLIDPATGQFEDWFELYNAGSNPLDLAGYVLSNAITNDTKFVIPAGTSLAGHGYLLVWADNQSAHNTTNSDLHVNFKLSKTGETIALFSPARTLVDTVSFGAQTSDVSQGRWPDGQSQIVSFPKATPGAPNANPSGVNQTRITSITAVNGMVTIVFETEPNQSYRVQFKDSLTGGDWTNLGDPVTATGASASLVDTLSANTQRYYRVLQLAAP